MDSLVPPSAHLPRGNLGFCRRRALRIYGLRSCFGSILFNSSSEKNSSSESLSAFCAPA